jgi:O-antigen ligase
LVAFMAGALYVSADDLAWSRLGFTITSYTWALSLFAILQFFADSSNIYGLVAPRDGGAIFGPYVNHNHYCGLLEFLCPLTAAAGLARRPDSRIGRWSVLACVLGVASVVLSGSRAGLACVTAEAALFTIVMLWRAEPAARAKLATAISMTTLAALAAGFWLMPAGMSSRYDALLNSDPSSTLRAHWTADTLRMTMDHPVVGVGLGAFQTAYPVYQTVASDFMLDYAHNDVAQLIAETGFIGALLLVLMLVVFARSALGIAQELSGGESVDLQFGAAIGVVGVVIHSFFDFNLHIPANAAWFAFCVGLMAASRSTRREVLGHVTG